MMKPPEILIKYHALWLTFKMCGYTHKQFRKELDERFSKDDLLDLMIAMQKINEEIEKTKHDENMLFGKVNNDCFN